MKAYKLSWTVHGYAGHAGYVGFGSSAKTVEKIFSTKEKALEFLEKANESNSLLQTELSIHGPYEVEID